MQAGKRRNNCDWWQVALPELEIKLRIFKGCKERVSVPETPYCPRDHPPTLSRFLRCTQTTTGTVTSFLRMCSFGLKQTRALPGLTGILAQRKTSDIWFVSCTVHIMLVVFINSNNYYYIGYSRVVEQHSGVDMLNVPTKLALVPTTHPPPRTDMYCRASPSSRRIA